MSKTGIWIAVFDNKSENPKAPLKNVVINFPDGTKLEGGLWEKESKAGNTYLSGQLRPSEERDDGRTARSYEAKPKRVSTSW